MSERDGMILLALFLVAVQFAGYVGTLAMAAALRPRRTWLRMSLSLLWLVGPIVAVEAIAEYEGWQ